MTKFTVELTDENIDYLVQAIRLQAEAPIRQLTKPRDDEMANMEAFLQKLAEDYEFKRYPPESNETQGKADVSPQEQILSAQAVVKMFSPYGLKKDGTPAKRRGRPSTKKAKA